ncbi:MAG TPA: hypothetical protein VMG12_07320 [Polyangiaceae bacterium]|nr:hypothetical protein [Polyangiaceae bacterium]
MRGGQSGTEGEGNLPAPETTCACLFSGVLGEVLDGAGPCTRVRVLDTFDVYPNIAVGEVLVGVLQLACPASAPIATGDRVLFEYFAPGSADQCPERTDCWQTCNPASAECGKACAAATAEMCADDVEVAHQTGRIVALSLVDDQVHFHFAGSDRVASVDELLGATCNEEHSRVLDAYERERAQGQPAVDASDVCGISLDPSGTQPLPACAAMASMPDRAPPPPPDPADCYSPPSD